MRNYGTRANLGQTQEWTVNEILVKQPWVPQSKSDVQLSWCW